MLLVDEVVEGGVDGVSSLDTGILVHVLKIKVFAAMYSFWIACGTCV